MHLKSLTLKGFKSFADKTVLALEPGITAVVGPNGTGKSNISDAVLWVFGEQSAKSLRGSAMEDVIFSGSSARQAVGVAEVDLVLDNSDGFLPIEFSEVTLTRRMYRSGESEYLINQSPARLMDILDVLHDAGLGRDAHSVISQGRIDDILRGRPEDRRALIEEAAGVLKHKKRRDRAIRKLAGLDASLERANDIAVEIDRQLRPLERQASRAAKHGEIVTELRKIEVALAVDDLRTLQREWDTLTKAEREADAEVEFAKLRLTEREEELDKFHHLLEEKGLFVGDISEQRRRMQSIEERLDGGLALLEEKGKNLVDKLSTLRLQLHHAESRISGARQQRDDLAARRADTESRLKALYSQLGELRKEGERVRRARVEVDEQLTGATSALRANQSRLADAKDKVRKTESSLESLDLQTELLAGRSTALVEEVDSTAEALAGKRVRIEGIDAALKKIAHEIALADNDVDKRVRVLEDRRKSLAQVREEIAAAAAEERTLEEVDRAFRTASPALAHVISKADSIEGLLGPVADQIQAESSVEPLVEKLLGADLFGVFVADSTASLEVAAEVKSVEFGELSIIPIDRPAPQLGTPSIGKPLVSLISCDERYAPGVATLFGDVYVVDSIQSAVAASTQNPGFRFATPDGAVVWPSGKVTLGTQLRDSEGVLARKRRLNELVDVKSALAVAVGEAEAEVAVAEEALSAAQQDALELNQRRATIAAERDSVAGEVGRVEEQLDRATRERDSVLQRLDQVATEREQRQPELDDLRAAVSALESEIAGSLEAIDALTIERDSRFRDENGVTERLGTCQVDIATVSEREVYYKRQYTQLSREVESLESTISASQDAEQSLEMLRERIEPLHTLYAALREKAAEWSAMLADRARFEQADSASLHQTIQEAQDQVRAAAAGVSQCMEALGEVRVRKGQVEVEVNQSLRRVVEDLGTPFELALQMPDLTDRMESEDRAFTLRKRLANLGNVNPVAQEEYDALRTRRDYIQEQIDDLTAARKAINRVVSVIDKRIRERFLDTFELVDTHFQAVFSQLFPGGTAQLVLTEPDNPEESGVDFVVQPRGKRLKKMSLLSGGESSLAALSLMFAVNHVRPCPFFILDEVEAALDDANLRRFVSFVDAMRKQTQFLVITHQRRTMEVADTLYGVSMQADGVSKLVSQKLDRATREGEGTANLSTERFDDGE